MGQDTPDVVRCGVANAEGAECGTAPQPLANPGSEPLRSVHTTSFPVLLAECGVSVLVSTYQAGKLIMLRADGDRLNTHFRGCHKPMGLAADGGRLAIGTALEIWEYHDLPAVASKLEPAGRHDAAFLPRGSQTTGNIQIHDLRTCQPVAWVEFEEGVQEIFAVEVLPGPALPRRHQRRPRADRRFLRAARRRAGRSAGIPVYAGGTMMSCPLLTCQRCIECRNPTPKERASRCRIVTG